LCVGDVVLLEDGGIYCRISRCDEEPIRAEVMEKIGSEDISDCVYLRQAESTEAIFQIGHVKSKMVVAPTAAPAIFLAIPIL
jgi:hypothetical protein